MRVPFSFLTQQFSDPEPIFARIREFLKRCDFTLGEDLEVFEKRYAEYCGARHAVGVGSGTDALALSLRVAGVGPDDEVITAPNSFIATVGAIVQVGARPRFVDVGEDLNLDWTRIEGAITPKTKAILPVHWAGGPAAMTEILEIADRHQLSVVEDACQALGARLDGKSVGTFGVAGGFSVHPLKPLHVWGDGGVVVTNSEAVSSRLRLIRNHGLQDRDTVAEFGFNSRFDNLQAIVGSYVMETLDATIEKRIAHAKKYDRALGAVPRVTIPARNARAKHVYHLYQVFAEDRDGLLRHLNDRGIEAKVHYPTPLHLQPAAAKWGYGPGSFPVSERQSAHSVTLPCHQYLAEEHIEYVIDTIRSFYRA